MRILTIIHANLAIDTPREESVRQAIKEFKRDGVQPPEPQNSTPVVC